MESRQSGSQRQRSASMFTNLQSVATEIDPIQQKIDNFATSFPTYNFEINLSPSFLQPTQTYTQQTTSQPQQQQYRQQQSNIAKPYHQFKTPFPLELDKRFMIQDNFNPIGKRKAKQKTPSDSVRCCEYIFEIIFLFIQSLIFIFHFFLIISLGIVINSTLKSSR